jgi:hypothetical protein
LTPTLPPASASSSRNWETSLRLSGSLGHFCRKFSVLSVFFGWLGLTFHLAKLPTVGIYIFLATKELNPSLQLS